jgi:carbonic anhydrase
MRNVFAVGLAGFIAAGALRAVAAPGAEGAGITADQALQKLMIGNQNYMSGTFTNEKQSTAAVRQTLVAGQKPYAVILSCADSRVPPEIVFDKGLGEIFVIRVAGNVTDPVVLGSIEYAVEHLGSPLIMVLGHTRCGAVTAAVEGKGEPHGSIGAILDAIKPAAAKAKQECGKAKDEALVVDCAVDENVKLVGANLKKHSKVISHLVQEGKVKIALAKYSLETGKVSLLD